jgi:hypothetical protein
MGKGSKRRPQEVSDKEFKTKWDSIFKKDEPDERAKAKKGNTAKREEAKS